MDAGDLEGSATDLEEARIYRVYLSPASIFSVEGERGEGGGGRQVLRELRPNANV